MNKIYVIGIGFKPLEKKASHVVLSSDVVLANDRLLNVFKNYPEYEGVQDRVLVHGGVYETIDYIRENYQKKKLSLLAAGDPMFFGIGRLVVEKFGQDAVEVFPDLSSIQVAFSRIKETSNNALLMSLHGGPDPEKRRKLEYDITELPLLLEKHSKIAILTDKVNSPEKIAGTTLETSTVSVQPSAIKIYVCEKLGYSDEKITVGNPEEIATGSFEHPNVVVLVSATVPQCHSATVPQEMDQCASDFIFGLKESEIEYSKGLITKDEVRAVTIHKLRLPQKGVFWDIGAGSGSVSVEAARLFPGLEVYAIEKREEMIGMISKNKESYGIANLHIVKGSAPDIVKSLPAPDRVFVGGSGGEINALVELLAGQSTSGIVVINATTIETLHEALQCLEKNNFGVDVSGISVSRSKIINEKRHMRALNPIFIITGEKRSC